MDQSYYHRGPFPSIDTIKQIADAAKLAAAYLRNYVRLDTGDNPACLPGFNGFEWARGGPGLRSAPAEIAKLEKLLFGPLVPGGFFPNKTEPKNVHLLGGCWGWGDRTALIEGLLHRLQEYLRAVKSWLRLPDAHPRTIWPLEDGRRVQRIRKRRPQRYRPDPEGPFPDSIRQEMEHAASCLREEAEKAGSLVETRDAEGSSTAPETPEQSPPGSGGLRRHEDNVLARDYNESPEEDGGQSPATDAASWWSPKDLAKHHNVPQDALRKRLERWRKQNGEGWMEVSRSERKSRDPKFLYQLNAVQPVIDEMNSGE